ncbi:MAG: hypothetical protein ACTSVI_14805 [Promethearchaeota archaeon]
MMGYRNWQFNSRIKLIIFVTILVASIVFFLSLKNTNHSIRKELNNEFIFQSDPDGTPALYGGRVDKEFGHVNYTCFNFSVIYQDNNNASPSHINVTVLHENWTGIYELLNVSDNYIAGVDFYLEIHLPLAGNYSFYFTTSNGVNFTRYPASGSLNGPNVVELRNYTIKSIPFTWKAPSNLVYLYNSPIQLFNRSIGFSMPFYGRNYKDIQISLYGFARFDLLSISTSNLTNQLPFDIPTSITQGHSAIVAISNKTFSITEQGFILRSYVYAGDDYFLIEQQFQLYDNASAPTKQTNVHYEALFFKNGSIILSYKQFNFNYTLNESVGVNFGDGLTATLYNFSSNITNVSIQFDYPLKFTPTIENHSQYPGNGNQATIFSFNITIKDYENIFPDTVTLSLNTINYTMTEMDMNDGIIVDGKTYEFSIQYLNPNKNYSFQFHVLTRAGWYHSPLIQGPNVTWEPTNNYTASRLVPFEWQEFINPVEHSIYSASFFKISLPFNFSFYDVNYSEFYISSNGIIKFTDDYQNTTLPVPGGTDDSFMNTITILDVIFWYASNGGSILRYEVFPDKFVAQYVNIGYSGPNSTGAYLGDFQVILHSNGDIIFSFLDIMEVSPSGINLGDGVHYTLYSLTRDEVPPLENVSFIFTRPKANINVSISINDGEKLITTTEIPSFIINYSSVDGVPISRAYCLLEGVDFNDDLISPKNYSLSFDLSHFLDYTKGIGMFLNISLPSGKYNFTVQLIDIYRNVFTTERHDFIVNDPPSVSLQDPIPSYKEINSKLNITLLYQDPENDAPDDLYIKWDGIIYPLSGNGDENFDTGANFSISIELTHGSHSYEIILKDKYWNTTVIFNGSLQVFYPPEIEVIKGFSDKVFFPGSFLVLIKLEGKDHPVFLTKYVTVDDHLNYTLEPTGDAGIYSVKINLSPGNHEIKVIVSDGYFKREVLISEVEVINLPLILTIILISAGCALILTFYYMKQVRQKRQQKVLLKKELRRKSWEKARKLKEREEKQQLKDETAKRLELVKPEVQLPANLKVSARIKKTVKGSGASSSSKQSGTNVKLQHSKTRASSSSKQRDKTKYAPKATDVGTVLNKTVIKQYLEKMRRERTLELHYLRIKTDLNVISKKKSRKLYKLLQDLVDDKILVRKGSRYIIVK